VIALIKMTFACVKYLWPVYGRLTTRELRGNTATAEYLNLMKAVNKEVQHILCHILSKNLRCITVERTYKQCYNGVNSGILVKVGLSLCR